MRSGLCTYMWLCSAGSACTYMFRGFRVFRVFFWIGIRNLDPHVNMHLSQTIGDDEALEVGLVALHVCDCHNNVLEC